MATIRPFNIFDTLIYNNINLDIVTETFHTFFYGKYEVKWPEYCMTVENCTNQIQAYLIGKIEGHINDNSKKDWHGHVSAITVSPESRRQGLARYLMNYLENITNQFQILNQQQNYIIRQKGYFVDLFVRPSNKIAVQMYKNLGYNIYRTVNKYYSSQNSKSEDAYGIFISNQEFFKDMRKSLSKDPTKQLSQPTNKKIEPHELEFQ